MLLTAMIFIPLIGMVVVLLLPQENEQLIKRVALAITFVPLLLAVFLFVQYNQCRDVECVTFQIDGNHRNKHQHTAEKRIQEEFNRSILAPRPAPNADQEIHREQR